MLSPALLCTAYSTHTRTALSREQRGESLSRAHSIKISEPSAASILLSVCSSDNKLLDYCYFIFLNIFPHEYVREEREMKEFHFFLQILPCTYSFHCIYARCECRVWKPSLPLSGSVFFSKRISKWERRKEDRNERKRKSKQSQIKTFHISKISFYEYCHDSVLECVRLLLSLSVLLLLFSDFRTRERRNCK